MVFVGPEDALTAAINRHLFLFCNQMIIVSVLLIMWITPRRTGGPVPSRLCPYVLAKFFRLLISGYRTAAKDLADYFKSVCITISLHCFFSSLPCEVPPSIQFLSQFPFLSQAPCLLLHLCSFFKWPFLPLNSFPSVFKKWAWSYWLLEIWLAAQIFKNVGLAAPTTTAQGSSQCEWR